MITPLVSEIDWMKSLSALPSWDPPAEPVLLIAPHPDDETLGAGGFTAAQRARGVKVLVVAVTDGENAYCDCPGLGNLRSLEQERALGCLGVCADDIVRLRLRDSGVASMEQVLIEELIPLVSDHTHIVAPWRGDFHPDHEACGRAAEEVARRTGVRLTSYFFWTWHRGTPELLRNLQLRSFGLSKPEELAKADALRCHHSQLHREAGEPILPESLLAPVRRPFEVFSVA
jgi:LmbE family N-acetylglucosaminyl deacetylase